MASHRAPFACQNRRCGAHRWASPSSTTTSPSITYTRADTILIYMKGGDSTGVSRVVAIRGGEPVDGVQLEQASLGRQRPSLGAARREEQP